MNFLCSLKRQGTVRALAVVALSALVGVALWLGLGRLRGSPSVHPDYDQILDFEPAREGGHLRPSVDMLVQGERVTTYSKHKG